MLFRSTQVVSSDAVGDKWIAIVKATMPDGRYTDEVGAVALPKDTEGQCNAVMKAITKGKRRAILSLCGLGMLDESELDTMGVSHVHAPVRPADVFPDQEGMGDEEMDPDEHAEIISALAVEWTEELNAAKTAKAIDAVCQVIASVRSLSHIKAEGAER